MEWLAPLSVTLPLPSSSCHNYHSNTTCNSDCKSECKSYSWCVNNIQLNVVPWLVDTSLVLSLWRWKMKGEVLNLLAWCCLKDIPPSTHPHLLASCQSSTILLYHEWRSSHWKVNTWWSWSVEIGSLLVSYQLTQTTVFVVCLFVCFLRNPSVLISEQTQRTKRGRLA